MLLIRRILRTVNNVIHGLRMLEVILGWEMERLLPDVVLGLGNHRDGATTARYSTQNRFNDGEAETVGGFR